MVSTIPSTFDCKKELLDPYESYIRDTFQLNIEEWAKFRWIINCGVDHKNISGKNASDKNVIESYIELGKCNYEVICSLGFCKVALNEYAKYTDSFSGQKAIKDFYFHTGAVLDNLSRIIFIVTIPDAASKTTKSGTRIRHKIDRGELLRDYRTQLPCNYHSHLTSNAIEEIVNVRNIVTHYWKIPQCNRRWPRSELGSNKTLAWPYSEPDYANYSDWTPISDILEEHLNSLVEVQNNIYEFLVSDIGNFEKNNGIIIKSPI